MRERLAQILTRDALIFLAVALPLLALVGYYQLRLNKISAELADSDSRITGLEHSISDLHTLLQSTAGNLSDIISSEEAKNASLHNQFSAITDTVDTLQKLSTTDPELLKKYSKVYFLNENYVPLSLSDIDPEFVSKNSTNHQFLSDALPFLENLFRAAGDDGMSLLAQSAYRSFNTQSALKSTYKVTYGAGTANSFSADQGYSEHQLGTALDFTTAKLAGGLDGFEKTPEYQWLLDNAYKYGFVISYPKGNSFYVFEPWHWRFVGVALATKLHNDNMYFYDMDQRTIDTYLADLFDQ